MIYIDDRIEQMNFGEALAAVSDQRRNQALRFRNVHDQCLSLAAYRLLQYALRLEYGIMEPPIFKYEAHGKPVLVDYPDIHFNLSHCNEAVACIVSSQPVGIDVESLSHYDEELVERVMSSEEQQQIAASPDSQLAFIRLWTMKESLLKMTGEGLVTDIRSVLRNDIALQNESVRFLTTSYPDFVCTVCFNTAEYEALNEIRPIVL